MNVFRYVADLSEEVSEVLAEGLDNKGSGELHRLKGVWDGGDKNDGVGKRVLGELKKYWRVLAQQGRTLEEAAR